MFRAFVARLPAEGVLVAGPDDEARAIAAGAPCEVRLVGDVPGAFCRAERLLSMARTPRQRALHNWLLAELVHQLDGASARPWDGNPGSASSSTSRVG